MTPKLDKNRLKAFKKILKYTGALLNTLGKVQNTSEVKAIFIPR